MVAEKAPILPKPKLPKPIFAFECDQVNIFEGLLPEKLIASVKVLLQFNWSPTKSTVGVWFTVKLKFFSVPIQVMPPLTYFGVTVKIDKLGLVPVFVAEKKEYFHYQNQVVRW